MNKLSFFVNSLVKYNTLIKCPSCWSTDCNIIDRKFIVLRLFECLNCSLYFRHPTENEFNNKLFYQNEYSEKGDSFTTYMPSSSELEELKNISFNSGSNRDIKRVIEIFQKIFLNIEGLKIIDYGSSWGYMSYQMALQKMNVQSYEISSPRADFGNKNLGLNIRTNESDLFGDVDIFFNSHVIEHVPSPSKMIETSKKLLSTEGVFVCICPNGSPQFRQKHLNSFHTGWGQVHPNYLNAEYFKKSFKNNPYFIGSYPTGPIGLDKLNNSQTIGDLSGNEIIVVAKPNILISL